MSDDKQEGAPRTMAVLDRLKQAADLRKVLMAEFDTFVEDAATSDRTQLLECWVIGKLVELQIQVLDVAARTSPLQK